MYNREIGHLSNSKASLFSFQQRLQLNRQHYQHYQILVFSSFIHLFHILTIHSIRHSLVSVTPVSVVVSDCRKSFDTFCTSTIDIDYRLPKIHSKATDFSSILKFNLFHSKANTNILKTPIQIRS